MNPEQLLEQFSTHLKQTVAQAISRATADEHGDVTPLHLLLAISEQQGAVGAEILKKLALEARHIRSALKRHTRNKHSDKAPDAVMVPALDSNAKQALEKAMLLAYEHGHIHVGTEHLLYGLMQIDNVAIETLLKRKEIDKTTIVEHVSTIVESTDQFPDFDDISHTLSHIDATTPPANNAKAEQKTKKKKAKRTPKKKHMSALELFSTELTDKEIQKNIDPVIGREEEIDRLINILCRRSKNNPILVGEPGVGKTAIVEGLAKRICEGEVPDVLKKKRILSLDLTLMIAGTIYRGEFESRLKQLIDEVGADPHAIVFIDEIHNIIGAGSNQGTMDAANILKPALARGKLRCIGATTIDEYKKHITTDPALQRRFQSITVEEPNAKETAAIIAGIKKYYERFHHTRITDSAVDAAVELSTKFIHDNFLPDKAIDLIDEAAAAVRATLKDSPLDKKVDELETALATCQADKEDAILDESFEKAMELKERENELEKRLETAVKKRKKAKAHPRKRVTRKHIVTTLSKQLHIDARVLEANDFEQIDRLEAALKQNIVGQDSAREHIVRTLRHAQLGLKDAHKPLASLLFAGPSGVGKTETAKLIAQELYHDDKALIKLDMSEFSEQHGVSKLLGSPAGYVGYNERNRFLDQVKERPYSVLVFDEIDKAHPDVARLLLQILDEGRVTDGSGRNISFKHTIIILTTNVGAEHFHSSGIGFGGDEKNQQAQMNTTLTQHFGATIMGRIDAVCAFTPLTNKDIEVIVEHHIATVNTRLAQKQRFHIELNAAARKALATEAYSKDVGARNVAHVVDRILQNLLTEVLNTKEQKETYTLHKTTSRYHLR